MAGLYDGLAEIGAASARANVWASWLVLAIFAVIMPVVFLFGKPPPPGSGGGGGKAANARRILQPTTPRARVAMAAVSALVGLAVFWLARLNARAAASSKSFAAYRGVGAIADLFAPRRGTLVDFDAIDFE